MAFDKGTNRILQIRYVGTYFPIGCLTDNSFNETAEVIDTTVRSNIDGWISSVPTKQNYNISFSGLLQLEESNNIITYDTIQFLKRNRAKIEWRITTNTIGSHVHTGEGYITSLGDSAAIDDFVTFTGEITGIGLPFSSNMPPTVTAKWIEIDDAWVYKGINTDIINIQIGDMIRRYTSTTRYIHARVNALPYTVETNLSLFEDIKII